jgi:protoporphyrinogen/coproporphyrinogen III oxidase
MGRPGRRARVIVIGGGLTGLATAWHLRDDAEVTLLEASARLGGEIRTVDFADAATDLGADAFLARQPEAERLARAVGLGDELVAPATGKVHLWVGGRLHPLPEGTVLGAPTDLSSLVRSGVMSAAGVARVAMEPLVPRRRVVGDRSVADLVGERFGREVVDVLVEPLLGGVYAGAAEWLSAQAAAPSIWAAARDHRSLTAGLAAHRARTADDRRPVFLTVRGGLVRLVDALAAPFRDGIRLGTAARALTRTGRAWEVVTDDGTLTAEHVVLAVPAAVAARLLGPHVPEVARELLGIRTASVGVVALAYDRDAAGRVPAGSGFLVPASEGRLVKAVTLTSRKWPHHAMRERFVLRASVGRVDDQRALELDDDTLALRVDAEVRWATGITAPATSWSVVRWPDALPQYDVGHLARVDRVRHGLRDLRGLHLGGASFDGLGLAARARDAERLAHDVRVASAQELAEATSSGAAPQRATEPASPASSAEAVDPSVTPPAPAPTARDRRSGRR